MCCTRLAGNTGRKMMQKNRHLRTIAQLSRAISSQLRHASTIGKKLVKQQYLLHMPLQYGELRPTSGWDRFVSLGDPSKFQRVSHIGSITARHSTSGLQPNCGVEQRAPPIFGMAGHHVGHWPTFLVYFCNACIVLHLRTSYHNFTLFWLFNDVWMTLRFLLRQCTCGTTVLQTVYKCR